MKTKRVLAWCGIVVPPIIFIIGLVQAVGFITLLISLSIVAVSSIPFLWFLWAIEELTKRTKNEH